MDTDSDGLCDECAERLSPVEEPDISEIELEDMTASYNGDEPSIEIVGELPDGVTVEYEGNYQTDAGVYEVVARFYFGGREMVGKSLSATLEIRKSSINMNGVSAEDQSRVYTGADQSPTLVGELPYGVSAVYSYEDATGNKVDKIVNVGEYKVTASFVYDEKNYNAVESKSFTYTVTRATYDMSDVYLPSVTKTYDGKAVVPAIVGALPEGVKVSYTYKNANGEFVDSITEIGVYTVFATFAGDTVNYYLINPISATVTVI